MAQRQFSQEIRLDPNVFLAFYEYVQKQRCHEALHFFLASEEYAALPQPHRAKAEAAIYAEYLVERAPEKINIADPVTKRIVSRKGVGLSHIYTEAHDLSVEILTGDAWPYFRDESLERVAKEKPIKDLKKAFAKAGMRPEIAKHALFLFTGKHEDKLETKRLPAEKLFDEWLNDPNSNKAEILSALIGVDPDQLFFRDLLEHFAASPDLLLDVFRRICAAELKDFGENNEEHLITKFREDSVAFEFFDEYFHFFGQEWCKNFLEPRVREFYALNFEGKDVEEMRSKVFDIAKKFLEDIMANPPSGLSVQPIKELTDLVAKKFPADRYKEVHMRLSCRWFVSMITKATAFPNSWLDERLRVQIMSRQYVAIIEELLHASYLPDKARRYICAPAALVKKMRETYQDKVIAFMKDQILTAKKTSEGKLKLKKSSKDSKARLTNMSHYAYAIKGLLPPTLKLPDKLKAFFDLDLQHSGESGGSSKSKDRESRKGKVNEEEKVLQDDKGVRLVLLVGFSGVGRTAILNRMVDDSFGKTFYSKNDEISSVFKFSACSEPEIKGIPVQIVSPALDEKTPFDDLPYLDRASGCLIVFDLTDFASFTDLAYWWEVAQKRYLPTVLLGNHLDECPKKREVNYEKTLKWAEDHSVKYFEVSAKSGENLQRAMESLVEGITLFKK